jgi:hypothetical protein
MLRVVNRVWSPDNRIVGRRENVKRNSEYVRDTTKNIELFLFLKNSVGSFPLKLSSLSLLHEVALGLLKDTPQTFKTFKQRIFFTLPS